MKNRHYVKVHYLDFFDKILKTFIERDSKWKLYSVQQLGKSATGNDWLVYLKHDFTKGHLPKLSNSICFYPMSQVEFLDLVKESFQKQIKNKEDQILQINDFYLMQDRSSKTEYYFLEYSQEI